MSQVLWHDMRVPRPGLRAPRAAFFAAVCVVVSSGAHIYAGGAPVRPGVLTLALALVFGPAYLLAGRERTTAVLLPAAFLAQYGLHHLFSWGAEQAVRHLPAAGLPLDGGMARRAAHLPIDTDAVAAHTHDTSSFTMILAHLVVALLTAAWMARGEAALCSLLRRLGGVRVAVPLLALLLPDPPALPRPVQAPRRVAVPVTEVLRTAIARRGPPAPISS